jgi:uncharacterized protein YciI
MLSKRSLIYFLFLFFSSCLFAQSANNSKDKLFAMIYSTGKNWDKNLKTSEQAFFKEHSEHLQKLRKEAKILIGGKYSDFGFIILKVKDLSEAKNIVEKDLSVKFGTFKAEVHEFIPFYYGAIEKD